MSPEYLVNEMFYSLQGEGVRTGTSNLFLRFARCNLRCDVEASSVSPGGWRCDTEFDSGRRMTTTEILATAHDLAPACRWIIFTGGEPSLQLDAALVHCLQDAGYYLAIETNGTKNLDALALNWICVSPKTAEHTLRQLTAHEVKYVRCAGQGLPVPRIRAQHYLISPAFEPDGSVLPETVRWCVQLCKDHPPWRLSVQTHKWLQVR
jgi:7-carboxy-7-deazaguanine synthase